MKTYQEALSYGLSFPNTYQEAPFHDDNWQVVRIKGTGKIFLCLYHTRLFYQTAYSSILSATCRNLPFFPIRDCF